MIIPNKLLVHLTVDMEYFRVAHLRNFYAAHEICVHTKNLPMMIMYSERSQYQSGLKQKGHCKDSLTVTVYLHNLSICMEDIPLCLLLNK